MERDTKEGEITERDGEIKERDGDREEKGDKGQNEKLVLRTCG
jgi:hypothetical protein